MQRSDRFIKQVGEALARGDLDAASRALRATVCCQPDDVKGTFNLGVLHARKTDAASTERYYRRALMIDPRHEGASGNLADLLLSQDQDLEAEEICVIASNWVPLSARVLGNLALVRVRQGNSDDAFLDTRRAVLADPSYAKVWQLMGMLRHDEAEMADGAYKRAWYAGLRDPSVLTNRGEIAQRDGRISDAIALYRAALEKMPEDPDVLANLATANVDDGDFDSARINTRRVLSAFPNHRVARWIASWVALAHRDFDNGYRAYDDAWRSPDRDAPANATAFRLWDGGRIGGALLLWCEQGLGDEILYAGMIDDVLALGVSVVLEAAPRLVPLFQRSWPSVRVIGRGTELPSDIVAQSSVLRLPMLFRRQLEDFPPRPHYLVADPEKVAAYKDLFGGLGDGLTVGLAWRSGNQRTGSAKSTQLSHWNALLDQQGVNFLSLQYDDGGEVDSRLHPNLGHDVKNDVDDLAAQIAALDHVVSISGVTAHLAGALGTSGHVLLPPAPLWFWFAEGADCPWYPTLTLFRRARGEAWERPVARVGEAVRGFLTS
jgi:Flp pilus assembly protein TadD